MFLLDRKKDMIITGGENVYSSEVEAVLYQHEDVHECAVVGIVRCDCAAGIDQLDLFFGKALEKLCSDICVCRIVKEILHFVRVVGCAEHLIGEGT